MKFIFIIMYFICIYVVYLYQNKRKTLKPNNMKNAEILKKEARELEKEILKLLSDFIDRNGDCGIDIEVSQTYERTVYRQNRLVGTEVFVNLKINK